jgi:hypothetical protein
MTETYRPRTRATPLILGRVAPTRDEPPRYRPFKPGEAPARPARARHGEYAKLLVYAGAVLGVSMLSQPHWLLLALLATLAGAGRRALAVLRRALLAGLAFSAMVSIAYVVQMLWLTGTVPWSWLASVNLRVLAMAALTFTYIERANLFAALAFSERLSLLLVLTVSQAIALRRTLEDFRLAMLSRGLRRAGLRHRYRAAAHAAAWLLDRALANAHESARALQARGVFR